MDQQSTQSTASSGPETPPADAFRAAISQIAELREYVGYYVAARMDAAKGSLRRSLVTAVFGAVMGVIGATFLVVSVVLLCIGGAQGIAALLGDRPWAGNLIIGGGLLVLILVGLLIARSSIRRSMRRETVKKYEQRRSRQRHDFGHDVAERAETARAARS